MARTRTSVSLDLIMSLPFTVFSLKDKSAFTAWKIILVSASSCVHCKFATSCAPFDVKDITLVPSLRPPAGIISHSGCSDNHVVLCFFM